MVAAAASFGGCWSASTTLHAERPLLDAGAGDGADPATDGAGDDGPRGDDASTDAAGLEDVAEAAACGMVEHSDGFGDSFCDAVPWGNYNQQLAGDACQAFAMTHIGHACAVAFECADGIQAQGPDDCVTWIYGGPLAGFVRKAAACQCPTNSDPMYK
jgi:hypothetical protein